MQAQRVDTVTATPFLLLRLPPPPPCFAAAGADINATDPRHHMHSYNAVQTAVNNCHFEAALRLVELGLSWRLPRGTPSHHTVPALAAARIPGAQVRGFRV